MSYLEITMLLCFGFAWPFSIWKSYKSRHNEGKSLIFLYIVLIGYFAGIAHKILYDPDLVIVFYIINSLLVLADILLFYRNARLSLTNRG